MLEGHRAVDRLAHVIDGEQTYRDGGHRFHLYPGAPDRLYRCPALDRVSNGIHFELNCNACEGERMAQRDELSSPFGGLDCCDACYAKHVAFGSAALQDQSQCGCLHHNTTGGYRYAMGLLLVDHVHHVGLAAEIEVGQFAHVRK